MSETLLSAHYRYVVRCILCTYPAGMYSCASYRAPSRKPLRLACDSLRLVSRLAVVSTAAYGL